MNQCCWRSLVLSLTGVMVLFGCSASSPSQRNIDVIVMDASVQDSTPLVPDAAAAVDAEPNRSVFFVSPEGMPDGDGRRRTPFPSVQTAYAVSSPGDLVVLLPGSYDEFVSPPTGVVVQGSGVDVTSIPGPIVLDASDVGLGELTVVGGAPALTVSSRASLDTVVVTQAALALQVTGSLVARDLRIISISGDSEGERGYDGPNPSPGAAVRVEASGRLEWRGGQLSDCDWVGLRNFGEVSLQRLALRRIGAPAIVNESGRLQGQELHVSEATAAGVLVLGGEAELTQSTLTDTVETPLIPLRSGLAAYGGQLSLSGIEITGVNRGLRLSRGAQIAVSGIVVTSPTIDGVSMDGARIEGEGVSVSEAGNTGLSAVGDSEVNLRDVDIRNVGRIGLLVNNSSAHVAELLIEGSDGRGVTLSGAQGSLSEIDISQIHNVAIQVSDPAGEQRIENGRITRCSTSGIGVTGRQHEVVISGVTISEIAIGEAALGEGIHLYRARALLSGVTSHNSAGAGVLVEESTLRTDGLEVRDNTGPGVVLVGSTPETVINGLVATNNGGAGALILQGQATFNQFQIGNTRRDLAVGPGDGVVASVSATVQLARGRSDDNAGSGYSIQAGCTATLDTVTASGNTGWGLQQVCGQSMVEVRGASVFEGNAAGTATECP